MTNVIRNLRLEENDFAELADDDRLPEDGKFVVSLARWEKEFRSLNSQFLTIGVRLPNAADLDKSWHLLKDVPLLVLEFPTFGDGRAYSQARLLRDRYRYQGEIRAVGAAVVRDQLFGMRRCGINAFELRLDQDPNACLTAFTDFSYAYQIATDSRATVTQLRNQVDRI